MSDSDMTEKQNSSRPKVSVVIPFYRYAQWLCEAVDSVLGQDEKNIEILVINDGSPEDTTAFRESYADRVRYIEKENGGAASARNEGIRLAQGDYIAFLDSDDLWTENKLSVQLQKMEEYGAVWSMTDYEQFGEDVPTARVEVIPGGREGFVDSIPPYIATPTIIVSKQLLTDNGLLFCEDLRFGQDAVLWEQLFHAAPSLYIPENTARVRIRGTNAGKRAAVQIHTRVAMYDKCIELIPGYKQTKSGLFRTAVGLCRFGRVFVRRDSKSGINEFFARVLFALPYLLFKLDRKRGGASRSGEGETK